MAKVSMKTVWLKAFVTLAMCGCDVKNNFTAEPFGPWTPRQAGVLQDLECAVSFAL